MPSNMNLNINNQDHIALNMDIMNEENERAELYSQDYQEFISSALSSDGEEPEFQYFSTERLQALAARLVGLRYFDANADIRDRLMNEWYLIHQDYLRREQYDTVPDASSPDDFWITDTYNIIME